MNTTNTNTNSKSKTIALLVLSLLLLILLIAIVGIAYAKFTASVNGTATAQVAKMVCNMDVEPSAVNNTIINPYCTVTLTNFNNSTDISQTDLNYRVEVSPKSGLLSLPTYYWEDEGGNRVGNTSSALTGSFSRGIQDTQIYKVIFMNSGESDITAEINFDLIAIQDTDN